MGSLASYLAFCYRGKLLSRYALMGALAVFGFGVGVLPLAIRNYLAFHRLAVTSLNGGINLLLGNNPYANGMYPNDAATVAKAVALVKRSPDEFEYNRNLIVYAKSYMANHPLRAITLWWRKIFYLYAFEVDGINRTVEGMHSGGRRRLLKVITQGYYTLLISIPRSGS